MEDLRFAGALEVPVCGTVALTETEMTIVETADFQRMRGVRQLGTVVWAYPTALHTRFEHSLGTLSKAEEMLVAAIRAGTAKGDGPVISIEEHKLTRMYALLHDVTHVPFGHTIEDDFGLFGRHGKNAVRTERFLGRDSEIGSVLRRMESVGFYDRLMAVCLLESDGRQTGGKEGDEWEPLRPWLDMVEDDAFVQDIVSNGVCADVLDYSARDAHYCGVAVPECGLANATYVKHAIVEDGVAAKRRAFLALAPNESGRTQSSVLEGLERLMEVGDVLSRTVYGHDVTLVASAMLARAFQEYDQSRDDESYLYIDSDDGLVGKISHWEKGRSRMSESSMGLATLLRGRRFHQEMAVYDPAVFASDGSACGNSPLEPRGVEQLREPRTRRNLENALAAEIGQRAGAVLVYPPVKTRPSKATRGRVEWRGVATTVDQIDDPSVAARVQKWRTAGNGIRPVRLFVSEEVSREEARVVKRTFDRWMAP